MNGVRESGRGGDRGSRGRRVLGLAVSLAIASLATAVWALWSRQTLRAEIPRHEERLRDEVVRAMDAAVEHERGLGQRAVAQAEERHRVAVDALQLRHLSEVEALAAEAAGKADEVAALQSDRIVLERDLVEARRRGDESESELAAARAELEVLVDEREASRRTYNELVGRNARLLEQVLERDRRLDALGAKLAELAARGPERSSVVESPEPGQVPLAARFNEALRAAGAERITVVQVASVGLGGARDLLVRLEPLDGAAEALVIGVERAVLTSSEGRVSLALLGAREAADDQPFDLPVPLPEFDAPGWAALGLEIPAAGPPLSRVRQALAALVAPGGWSVASLGSFDGTQLADLELRQVDERGQVLRSLFAPRATVDATVQVLELHGGSVAVGGEVRPFYDGLYRLALHGADAAGWYQAIGVVPP